LSERKGRLLHVAGFLVAAVMLMIAFTLVFKQSNPKRVKPVAVVATNTVRVSHADQRFFGAKVTIWGGEKEQVAEFPMGTSGVSDENPHQVIDVGAPIRNENWFLRLKMDYGENVGREFSFKLEEPNPKASIEFQMGDNDKPIMRHDDRVLSSDLQPTRLNFYTFNELFVGARVSIVNEAGRVLWVHIPELPKSEYRNDHPGPADVKVDVPEDFDLTRTYTMRIHFRNGTVSRYSFYRIGADHLVDGEPSFYLHVCSEFDTAKGPYGLRPRVLLNGVEERRPDQI
jgi:hypothetical protein